MVMCAKGLCELLERTEKDKKMRTRGSKYWMWADTALHSRSHEEICSDGTAIDVQVRLSRTGSTQLFIGVYAPSGLAKFEGTALAWGIDRAHSVVANGAPVAELLAISR